MSTKNVPGKYDCYANAEPDEPMFVLLARDVHAPFLLRAWADIREANGEAPSKVEEARACADAMARWNEKSRGRKPLDTQTVFDLFKQGSLANSILTAFDGDAGRVQLDDEFPANPFDWDSDSDDLRKAEELLAGVPVPSAGGITALGGTLDGPAAPAMTPAVLPQTPAVPSRGSRTPAMAPVPPSTPPGSVATTSALPGAIAAPAGAAAALGAPSGAPLGSVTAPAGAVVLGKVAVTTAVLPPPGPTAPPPKPVPVRTVPLSQWVTIGVRSEFELKATPQFVFRLKTAKCNVPCLGFIFLTDWKIGNMGILFDKVRQDFYRPDVYEYCVKGAGKIGIDAPPITPNHGLRLTAQYSGLVPDGFHVGEAFEFKFELIGEAPAWGMV